MRMAWLLLQVCDIPTMNTVCSYIRIMVELYTYQCNENNHVYRTRIRSNECLIGHIVTDLYPFNYSNILVSRGQRARVKKKGLAKRD